MLATLWLLAGRSTPAWKTSAVLCLFISTWEGGRLADRADASSKIGGWHFVFRLALAIAVCGAYWGVDAMLG
jgi:hypothetical protein